MVFILALQSSVSLGLLYERHTFAILQVTRPFVAIHPSPHFIPYFLFNIITYVIIMYGSENWSLKRSDKTRIEAAEMRFLRSMAGYTLWDEKRSTDIRKELGNFNINEKLT